MNVTCLSRDVSSRMSARDDGAVTPSAGAVTFTATPLPGQEPPTSLITQPTLFIDDVFPPRPPPPPSGNDDDFDDDPPSGPGGWLNL